MILSVMVFTGCGGKKKDNGATVTVTEAPQEVTPVDDGLYNGTATIKSSTGKQYILRYDDQEFNEVNEWGGVAIQMHYAKDGLSTVTVKLIEYENFDSFASRMIESFGDGRQVTDVDGLRCIEYTQMNSYDKKYCIELEDSDKLGFCLGIEFMFKSDNVDKNDTERIIKDIIKNFGH